MFFGFDSQMMLLVGATLKSIWRHLAAILGDFLSAQVSDTQAGQSALIIDFRGLHSLLGF